MRKNLVNGSLWNNRAMEVLYNFRRLRSIQRVSRSGRMRSVRSLLLAVLLVIFPIGACGPAMDEVHFECHISCRSGLWLHIEDTVCSDEDPEQIVEDAVTRALERLPIGDVCVYDCRVDVNRFGC